MKVCPCCGFQDNLQWRASRFDFDADYMRFDEADSDASLRYVVEFLRDKRNFETFVEGAYTFYRRGTGGLWLYRVLTENFRVPRERKNHNGNLARKESTTNDKMENENVGG